MSFKRLSLAAFALLVPTSALAAAAATSCADLCAACPFC